MAYPTDRPALEQIIYARTTSIGASPVAGVTVATKSGYLQRAFSVSEGASTGTITITITTTLGGTGSWTFTGGSNVIGSAEFNKQGSGAIPVIEGDTITFTPSGGGGATIPGHFYAVIRA